MRMISVRALDLLNRRQLFGGHRLEQSARAQFAFMAGHLHALALRIKRMEE
jgi:hypothetical protein